MQPQPANALVSESEYWIVDGERAEIEQVIGLETVARVAAGSLTSRVLEGLRIEVETLLG